MKEVSLNDHKDEVLQLLTYLPWLEKKAGETATRAYDGSDLTSTLPFMVYDTMLLNFVNDASKTGLMNKNYLYAYSEQRLYTVEDEIEFIDRATVKDAAVLCSILSKYVLGGMTKGALWGTAVQEGVFLAVLKKMKRLLEIWDAPLA